MDAISLGKRLREARERKRLTQEEVAILLGKSQRTISEYENGQTRIFATDLSVIAGFLDVPIIYFLGDSEHDSLDEVMIYEFRQLPTIEARQSAIELVRVLRRLVNKESQET